MESVFHTAQLNIHFQGPIGVLNIFYNAGLLEDRESIMNLITLCEKESQELYQGADKLLSGPDLKPEWLINDAWWNRSKASKWDCVTWELGQFLTAL